MTCKLCAWLCNWLCADSAKSFWKDSEAWERDHSNEYELWSTASDDDHERIRAALAVQSSDHEAAFRIYLDLGPLHKAVVSPFVEV